MGFDAVISFFTNISIDWVVIGGCAVFFSFDALRSGTARVSALSIGLLLAISVTPFVAQTALLGKIVPASSDALFVAVFIGLAITFFTALYRMIDTGYDTSYGFVQAPIAGVATTGILMLVLLQLPASTWPWAISDQVQLIFGESYRLFWIVGGIISLAIVRK